MNHVKRILMCLCLCVAACGQPRLYGNFLEHPTAQTESFLALDVSAQLRRAYSPAATLIVLPDARDPFGQSLTARLRRLGFAVAEEEAAVAGRSGTTVRYIVDAIGQGYFRVTLVVQRTRDGAVVARMSRAYGAKADVLHPAGAWTRQTPAKDMEPAWTTN